MPAPATSFATPKPLSATTLATPTDSSMRRFTSSAGTGGGAGGVFLPCSSRLPRETNMPVIMGNMSRTYSAAPTGA